MGTIIRSVKRDFKTVDSHVDLDYNRLSSLLKLPTMMLRGGILNLLIPDGMHDNSADSTCYPCPSRRLCVHVLPILTLCTDLLDVDFHWMPTWSSWLWLIFGKHLRRFSEAFRLVEKVDYRKECPRVKSNHWQGQVIPNQIYVGLARYLKVHYRLTATESRRGRQIKVPMVDTSVYSESITQ